MNNRYQRIAVKVGSNVLTQPDGMLDINRMKLLVKGAAGKTGKINIKLKQ